MESTSVNDDKLKDNDRNSNTEDRKANPEFKSSVDKSLKPVDDLKRDDTRVPAANPLNTESLATAPVLSTDLGSVKQRTGIVSILEITSSKEKKYLVEKYKSTYYIKPWTDSMSWWKSYFDFVVNLVDYYDAFIQNVESETNTWSNDQYKITKTSAMGFDYPGLGDIVQDEDRGTIIGPLATARSFTDKRDPRIDHMVVAGLRNEIELQVKYSAMNRAAGTMEIPRVEKFLKTLNTTRNRLAALDPSILPAYDKIWMWPVTKFYTLMMDTVRMFRSGFTEVIKAQVAVSMQFESATPTTFKELIDLLGINVNVFAAQSAIPAAITSGDGIAAFTDYMTVLMANRWMRLDYELKMDRFDAVALLECILMKLLLPARVFRETGSENLSTSRTIQNIDNYIKLMLLDNLKGSRSGTIFDLSENMLTNYNAANFPTRMPVPASAFLNFLKTTERGGGWAGGGSSMHIDNLFPELHPSGVIWYSIYGQEVEHDDFADPYPQLRLFRDFANALVASTWSMTHAGELAAIGRLCMRVVERLPRIQQLAEATQRVALALGANSLTHVTPDSKTDDNITMLKSLPSDLRSRLTVYNQDSPAINRTTLMLRTGGISSMAFMTNFGIPLEFPQNHTFILQGWAVHKELRRFEELFELAHSLMPSGLSDKSVRIDFALSKMEGPVKLMLQRGLTETKRFDLPVIDKTALIEKVRLLEEYMIEGNEHMWGWVTSVIWNGRQLIEGVFDQVSKLQTLTQPRDSVIVITEEQLYDKVTNETFSKFMERARRNDISVIFEIEVPLELGVFTSRQFNSNVLDVKGHKILIQPLKQSLILTDEAIRTEANQYALWPINAYGSGEVPLRIVTISDLLSLLTTRVFPRGFTYHSPAIFTRITEDRIVG